MTIEHRVIVGFDDVKAVSLECLKCHSRVTFSADFKVDVPLDCERCGNSWRSPEARGGFRTSDSTVVAFVQAIPTIRAFLNEKAYGFNVLLEFEEPNSQSG
jgi:hypothetical protein